jgi:hypothetical protein
MEKVKLCLLSLLTLCCSLLILSCSSEEEGKATVDYSAPLPVTRLNATPIAGGVELNWIKSASANFKYAKVAYTDAKGKDQYILLSAERADSLSGEMRTVVRGFAKEQPVTFRVYACSVKGQHGEAAVIEATPQAPNFIKVLDKTHVTAAPGGAHVAYVNDFDETVTIKVVYASKADAAKTDSATFAIAPRTAGTQYVRFDCGNEILSGDCMVAVSTLDVAGNESDANRVSLNGVPAISQIDKAAWSVPDFNHDSSDGTIGYSSQEAVGEGSVKGRVTCLFDNDLNTFYHSRWKGGGGTLPQWFIIDLGRDYTVAQLELFARQDKDGTKGQVGEQVFVCNDAAAADKSDPTSWKWQDCGEHRFDPYNKKGQVVDLSASTTKVRYFKLYFDAKYRGIGNYAMLGEINIYTIK